jgi:hypothetical protein
MSQQSEFKTYVGAAIYQVVSGEIPPGYVMAVPLGYVVAGRPLNNVGSVGVRMVCMPNTIEHGCLELLEMLIPDPVAVKPNTAESFCLKMLKASGTVFRPEKRPGSLMDAAPAKNVKSER